MWSGAPSCRSLTGLSLPAPGGFWGARAPKFLCAWCWRCNWRFVRESSLQNAFRFATRWSRPCDGGRCAASTHGDSALAAPAQPVSARFDRSSWRVWAARPAVLCTAPQPPAAGDPGHQRELQGPCRSRKRLRSPENTPAGRRLCHHSSEHSHLRASAAAKRSWVTQI